MGRTKNKSHARTRALALVALLFAGCPDGGPPPAPPAADGGADAGSADGAPRCDDDGTVFKLCHGGECKFIISDPDNCGGCAVTCVTGQKCCSGVCLDETEGPCI